MLRNVTLFFLLLYGYSSFAQNLHRDSLIVSTFAQGKANNCASIALIKAGMLKYGYAEMFQVEKDGTTFHLTLKDNTKLDISFEELKDGENAARFDTNDRARELGTERDRILFHVYLAYAAIAKFVQLHGYWNCERSDGQPGDLLRPKKSYTAALRFISKKSFCTDYCYRLLGFEAGASGDLNSANPDVLGSKGLLVYSKNMLFRDLKTT